MKIICTQENLKNGLSIVSKIVSSSNTLPILNNIFLKTENGQLILSSTNLEIAITTQTRCKIEENGEVTVPSKIFTELVNNLPNKNITLITKENELLIETENYQTKIKTLPAEDFPQIPKIENEPIFSIPAEDLRNAINKVLFAVSINQTQPEICGVLVSLQETEIGFVATDRYRLAEKKVSLKTQFQNKEFIIPAKSVSESSRLSQLTKNDVSISFNTNQVQFDFGGVVLISRVVDGQYPDYKQIIPTTFTTQINLKKQDLVNALRASGIFSQSSGSVGFSFSKEKQVVSLLTESSDLGMSSVDIPSEVLGEDGNLVLNFRYLLDCLLSIEGEKVAIKIINESSPTVISSDEEKGYTYLVMPIKI